MKKNCLPKLRIVDIEALSLLYVLLNFIFNQSSSTYTFKTWIVLQGSLIKADSPISLKALLLAFRCFFFGIYLHAPTVHTYSADSWFLALTIYWIFHIKMKI